MDEAPVKSANERQEEMRPGVRVDHGVCHMIFKELVPLFCQRFQLKFLTWGPHRRFGNLVSMLKLHEMYMKKIYVHFPRMRIHNFEKALKEANDWPTPLCLGCTQRALDGLHTWVTHIPDDSDWWKWRRWLCVKRSCPHESRDKLNVRRLQRKGRMTLLPQ